jgi:glycosyltransferase involved in cell wall biosynthesis
LKILDGLDSCDVRVLGNLNHSDLAELFNSADVCVIPSILEATSLACLEAMACGLPVLGTDTGGLAELIREGSNG